MRVPNEHGIQDQGTHFQQILNGLRRDKLSRGCLEQILLAVGHVEIAFSIQAPDVAGGKPAIRRNHGARVRRLLVIAFHDAWAMHKNLAVLRNTHAHVLDGLPYGAYSVGARIIRAHDRRSLRQAVSLIDRHAHGPEKFSKFGGKWSAARNECPEAATNPVADFRIYNEV